MNNLKGQTLSHQQEVCEEFVGVAASVPDAIPQSAVGDELGQENSLEELGHILWGDVLIEARPS